MRSLGLSLFLLWAVLPGARADVPSAATTAQAAVVPAGPIRTGEFTTSFTLTTPLAEAREVSERLLHRIVFESELAQGHIASGQTIVPSEETWRVYVPEDYDGRQPYGVLVWITWAPTSPVPYGWHKLLSDHKLIYVSADKSGNDQSVVTRRIPLALTGLANIMAQYKIDPARVYIGGFSGGGVTASRIAPAYAEVFTGGLYVSTSDGLGSTQVPVPAQERYELMRDRGRYVFTNGDEEADDQIMNGRTVSEYKSLCVLHDSYIHIPNASHANLEPRIFARALKYLDDPSAMSVDPADQAACQQKLAERREASLAGIRKAFADGDEAKARDLLIDFHQQFGFMAEPDFSHFAGCLNKVVTAMDCLPTLKKPGG